jgi:hypothetical protein
MNSNSRPDAPRIISIRTWEKRPAPADRNSPLRQVLAASGGDAGPWARSAPANSNVLAGSWLGEVRGGDPVLGIPSREPQGCIVCSELAGDHGNLGRRSRRTVPATSRRAGRKVIHDYPRHFPEFLPLAPSRRRPPGSRTGTASRRDTGRRRGPGARTRARRGMIDTARIRGRPPRSDQMCHTGRRGHQLPDISSSIALK